MGRMADGPMGGCAVGRGRGRALGRGRARGRTVAAPYPRSPRISRAITSRWISLVPSPISQTLASRIIRSTG